MAHSPRVMRRGGQTRERSPKSSAARVCACSPEVFGQGTHRPVFSRIRGMHSSSRLVGGSEMALLFSTLGSCCSWAGRPHVSWSDPICPGRL